MNDLDKCTIDTVENTFMSVMYVLEFIEIKQVIDFIRNLNNTSIRRRMY